MPKRSAGMLGHRPGLAYKGDMSASDQPPSSPESDRTSPEDILVCVQNICNDISGKSQTITRDMRIDRYLNDECGGDSLEYIEFQLHVENTLGISLTADDWLWIAGESTQISAHDRQISTAPPFTFGRLVDLLTFRAQSRSLPPAGATAPTLKAVEAMETLRRIVRDVHPAAQHFDSHTEITTRLRGRHLKRLLDRIRWTAPAKLPEASVGGWAWAQEHLAGGWGVVLCLAAWIAGVALAAPRIGLSPSADPMTFAITALLLFAPFAGAAAILLFIVLIVTRTIGARPQLPPGMRTFGDLASLMAGERGGWCKTCGYDLSGIAALRCPECGNFKTVPPGAFNFLRRTLGEIQPNAYFGPWHRVERIVDKDRLPAFWSRVRSEFSKVPPLRHRGAGPVRLLVRSVLAVLAMYGVAQCARWKYNVETLSVWPTSHPPPHGYLVEALLAVPTIALASIALLILVYLLQRLSSNHARSRLRLPDDIVSFYDLAKLIAECEGRWCARCGGELDSPGRPSSASNHARPVSDRSAICKKCSAGASHPTPSSNPSPIRCGTG